MKRVDSAAIQVRLTPELLERLNEQMKRHRMNRAQVIRELVEQRVNELAGKEPA